MLRRQGGRLLCPILFTLGVPATKDPQEGKKVGILPQAPCMETSQHNNLMFTGGTNFFLIQRTIS